MVQYWFDGPPVELMIKPHGNSHTNKPFFVTAESAKKKHFEIHYRKRGISSYRISNWNIAEIRNVSQILDDMKYIILGHIS